VQVPAVQQGVVQKCRELNKPVIVASQLLESMIEFPTPTRAEVHRKPLSLAPAICLLFTSMDLSCLRLTPCSLEVAVGLPLPVLCVRIGILHLAFFAGVPGPS